MVSVALHDGGPGPHLGHDAARPPHVHCRPIVPLTQQQLRGPVPEGDHPVGVPVCLTRLVDGDGSSQTKVGQLQCARLGDQNVGSFHVSVDDFVGVDEEETLAHLLHHLLDLSKTELDVDVAQETSEVMLAEVKHQVESCLVAAVLATDLDQVHNVVMV